MTGGTGRRLLLVLALLALLPGCTRQPSAEQAASWNAEIGRLQAEQDSLRARAAELTASDPRIRDLPKGDVVLSIPTLFLKQAVGRVIEDVVDNITLTLSGIKAHVAKPVRKVIKIGEFKLDVEVHQVIGRLKTEQPDIDFGADRVTIALPVHITEGGGTATLHFQWDGKNIADLTCGDLDVTQTLAANVVPAQYLLTGSLSIALEEHEVVCTPIFPETKIRIRIEPSKAAWATIDSLLEEKRGVCGWVLDKVNVPEILEKIVQEKGINVRLPVDKIPPFNLPAGVQDSVQISDHLLIFDSRTNSLRVDPEAIWYSADVSVKLE